MTERLPNYSRIIPEPFPTSRARADQGAGNKGGGAGSMGLLLTFANADTREALATDTLPVAAGHRDAGQAMTRWLG